jgi:hypothetical protein
MDVSVQMPAAVEGPIPAPHRVMVEPDVLSLDLKHPLFNSLAEQRPNGSMVVVTPNQVNLSTPDTISVPSSLFKPPFAEITNDPQDVADPDLRINRIQESLIVAAHGFLGHPPRVPAIFARPFHFFR